jgi:hypothetical protein
VTADPYVDPVNGVLLNRLGLGDPNGPLHELLDGLVAAG